MRRTTKRILGPSGDASDASPEGPSPSPVQGLLRSGLFDHAYYSAASGEVFPDRRTAARHCVRVGMPSGLSPSPLLAQAGLPKPLRTAWRQGQVLRLLALLAAPERRRLVVGPLFDGGVYVDRLAAERGVPSDEVDLEGLSPLLHFLTRADDTTPLPVPGDFPGEVPTLGLARAALSDHAELVAAQDRELPDRDLSFHHGGDAGGGSPRGARPLSLVAPGRPLVSIIAPWPRTPAALSATLLGVQDQTLHRWELLLVGEDADDLAPPTDGRAIAVRSAPGEDWRSAGLARAEAPYVAFLAPGHRWRPPFLEAALKRLLATGREAGLAAVSMHDPRGAATVTVGYADLASLRSGGEVDLGVLVCETEAARAVGGVDSALGAGAAPQLALALAERGPLDSFPFVASDCMVAHLPTAPTSAAGADGDWLAVLGRAWVDWPRLVAGVPARVPGRVSVVIPTYVDATMTVAAVRSLLASTTVSDVEVIVVDNGSPMAVGQAITAAFLTEPRVRYRRLPVNLNFAIACNVGFAQSTGGVVVFLNNDTRSDEDWLPPVLARLEDPRVAGAQPLLLYPDGRVQTAGTVFPAENGLACHFLVGRLPEEAEAVGGLRFSAATAAALAMRAEDVAALSGFDAHFVNGMEDVDLCLRALALRPGGFRVVPEARVVHLEGKTKGRSKYILPNREFFQERWDGRLPGPELDLYAAAGFRVTALEFDRVSVPVPRPTIEPL